MKKILVGLLVLGSLSAVASSECNIELRAEEMENHKSKIVNMLEAKGYTVDTSLNAKYILGVAPLMYHFERNPRFITPLGASAHLYNSETKNHELFASKEDLAVIVGREDRRFPRLAFKAAKRLVKKMSYCSL